MRPTDDTARFTDDDSRWQAVLTRDVRADGRFLYGVITTGVYCRPSCPSRAAHRENVRFYGDACAARSDGLRACRRCTPDGDSARDRLDALIVNACRRIEANDPELRIGALAESLGLSRAHFQRQFKRCTGVTPKAYQQAVRRRAVDDALRDADSVTDALYDAGFASAARFYDGGARDLGMSPSARRRGAPGETLHYGFADTTLGRILVARTAQGLCAVLFGDSEADLLADLAERFPAATLERGDHDEDVARVVARIDRPHDEPASEALPLDIRGTAFQQRVWETLRALPVGSTASYATIADRAGRPKAARAVAAACAANPLAVLVPCHRVIRADGSTSGYRWGDARKRTLLDRERENTKE